MEQLNNETCSLESTCTHLDEVLEIVKKSEWRKSIAKAIRQYNLKIYNLNKLTPLRVKELHTIIVSKFNKSPRNKEYWNENQLRLFIWIGFTYAGAINKQATEFELEDWGTVAKCFADKTPFFCQFQFKCLKKISQNSDKWSREEDELLEKIIGNINTQEIEKLKWNEIAKQFYTQSNKVFFRTGKQCRQHWNTYLDPNKLKCGWSFNEDVLLVKAVMDFGRKWSKIAQLLQNKRSEHTVKNRYNSLISKFIKVKNPHNGKQGVEAQNLYEWLSNLQKEQEIHEAKVEAPSRNHPVPQDRTQQDPEQGAQHQQEDENKHEEGEYLEPLRIIDQRHEFIPMMSTHNVIEKVQSPAMLISPLPLSFGSIVFSPLSIYYRGDTDGGFNLFSFDNLRQ